MGISTDCQRGSTLSTPRFFVAMAIGPGDAGREFALPAPAAHHALRVLRLATGDPLTLFTGEGGEFAATLARADKRDAWVVLSAFSAVEREPALAVTLVQGIAANDAMDFIVRKAVELGVAAMQPVVTARGARFPADERGAKRLAHWRQIAVAACEQCGRNRVPLVHDVVDLNPWLAARTVAQPGVVLDPAAESGIAAMPAPAAPLDVLIGPEGGFTAEELTRAQRAGFTKVRLGPRILRTETASLAVLAAVNTLWGDFR
ncbi:MAG: 16S rRNA (uracil(1498)-N(3))-methyltransferase [Casimicrobiaceae bacterium]